MAPPRPVPDKDNLVRHVRSTLVAKDPDTNEPVGFTPQAFELREGEDYLSAAWPQFFPGSLRQSLAATMLDIAEAVEIKPKDCFAQGLVGEIRAVCNDHRVQVRIVHDGIGYPSHAAVRRYDNNTPELRERLAREAWAELIRPSQSVVQASKRSKAKRSLAKQLGEPDL